MSVAPTPTRLANLPKWAQSYIEALQHQLSDAERRANTARGEKTSIEVEPYHPTGATLYLEEGSMVRFNEGDDFFDVRMQDGKLRISTGFGMLRICPQAGNVVEAETVRW